MSFLSEYKSGDRSKMERDAFQYLVTDLMQDNLIGYKKTRELSALNMEQKSPTTFVPSMFYTFMYASTNMENLNGQEFYDAVPLILCTSFTGGTISGFNFNFIPTDVRASILDLLTSSYSEFYKASMNNYSDFKLNTQLGTLLSNPTTLKQFIDFVKFKTGVDISKSYRTYTRTGIIKVRMIEYDMWKYIPYLVFKDAVRGVNLADVQRKTIE